MVRFGELFLKSEPVRRHFMKVLMANIRLALSGQDTDYQLEESRSRILVHTDDSALVIAILSRVFGVVDCAPAYCTDPTIEALSTTAEELGRQHLTQGMSFAIRARRDQVQGFTSQELGAEAGAAVLSAVPGIRVDLTRPEYEIFLEARKEGGIAYDTRIPGPGGLPYGTQGSLISLLSAGIDSPVAAWLMMKRGVSVRFLYVDTGRYGGPDCHANVLRNLAALSRWTPGIRLTLTIIRAEPFFARLMDDADPRYRCVLCKRGMLMLGSAAAGRMRILGLITGDNLGQVATQTLPNLVTISSAVHLPVFRPLIGLDKEEIIRIARKIGTFSSDPGDTSCGVVPPRPATSAERYVIEEIEKRIQCREMIDSLSGLSEEISAVDGEIIRD
jgi:thiamine biosynthesis protein ThiI